ncbi:MAG: hypothetical protein IH849_15730 [Acidobacteria bacterium]|nr:hypothetical protein [Acidobacteriota bacterium]
MATIALGIGANTATIRVVNGVLLRPLPFEDEGSLVMVRGRWPAGRQAGEYAEEVRARRNRR